MVPTRVLSLALAASAAAAAAPVAIHDALQRSTSDNFLGVTLDSAYLTRYDLSDPRIVSLGKRLSGAVLRIGGTDADRIFLQMPDGRRPYSEDYLEPLGIPENATSFRYEILPVSIFDDAYAYAKATGMLLLWDLNALGTRLSNNAWDTTNAEQLFDYIKAKGYDSEGVLVGFQFGNEPFLNYINPLIKGHKHTKWVSGRSLGKDVKVLRHLLVQKGLDKMRVQASDACCYATDLLYTSQFLREVKDVPDMEFSFHLYSLKPPLSSKTSCAPEEFLKDSDPSGISYYQNLAKDWGFPGKVVLSETSAHNSGCNGVSDRFVHTLWWADYIGRAAADHGVWQLYRQSFLTPTSYGLVTTDGPAVKAVTPDYYTTVLWRKLVGSMLQIDGRKGSLRVYAACAAATAMPSDGASNGAVTLVFINMDDADKSIDISVDSLLGVYSGRVAEYRLESAGDWLDEHMTLNGVQLDERSTLEPHIVNTTGASVTLTGRSLGFFVLLDAKSLVCAGKPTALV